jgi:Flp pilus assembly protein protease CpaA
MTKKQTNLLIVLLFLSIFVFTLAKEYKWFYVSNWLISGLLMLGAGMFFKKNFFSKNQQTKK